jgi:uncharacterized protein YdeI (BOF family)
MLNTKLLLLVVLLVSATTLLANNKEEMLMPKSTPAIDYKKEGGYLSPTEPAPVETKTLSGVSTSALNNLIYPQSTVVKRTDSELTMMSDASTDVVTDWYETKLAGLRMNVNNTIRTSNNGMAFNTLLTSNGDREIDVIVQTDDGSKRTLINVTEKLIGSKQL